MKATAHSARRALLQATAVAVLTIAPALAFADSTQPITRAEVRAQIVELEQAGYNPFGYEGRLHRNLEAAERVIAERHATALEQRSVTTQPGGFLQAAE